MPITSAQDAVAMRSAIARGDDYALERYLREGGDTPLINATGATITLSPGITTFNRAAGITATLPLATGSGAVCTVVVVTTLSGGSGVIKVGRSADTMIGMMYFGTVTFAAGSMEAVGGTDDTITLVAASGGVQGTIVTCTDIAPNLWLVDGKLASTTAATVLSATV
jgi:hypothetical protein